jgi:hypothetical protein
MSWAFGLLAIGGAVALASVLVWTQGPGGLLRAAPVVLGLLLLSVGPAAAGTALLRGSPSAQRRFRAALRAHLLVGLGCASYVGLSTDALRVDRLLAVAGAIVVLALPLVAISVLLFVPSTAQALRPGSAARRLPPVAFGAWAGPMLLMVGGVVGTSFLPLWLLFAGEMVPGESRMVVAGLVLATPVYPLVFASGVGLVRRSEWALAIGAVSGAVALLATLVFAAGVLLASFEPVRGERMLATVPLAVALLLPAWVALGLALRHRFRLPPNA